MHLESLDDALGDAKKPRGTQSPHDICTGGGGAAFESLVTLGHTSEEYQRLAQRTHKAQGYKVSALAGVVLLKHPVMRHFFVIGHGADQVRCPPI